MSAHTLTVIAHGIALQPSISSQHSASVHVLLAHAVLGSVTLDEYPVVQDAPGKGASAPATPVPSELAAHVTVESVHVSEVLVAELSV